MKLENAKEQQNQIIELFNNYSKIVSEVKYKAKQGKID